MKSNEILDIMVKTSDYIGEIFLIKDARFERIKIENTTECFFSWIEANGERVHYEFVYDEKKNLVCIQRRYRKDEKNER